MHEALLRAYLQTAAHRPLTEEAFGVYMQSWLGDVGQPAFYRQIAQMEKTQTDEVQEQYGLMDCDVKVLWGDRDEWIPFERGQEFANLIANGQITRFAHAGHLVQEDAPEAIVAAMLDR